MSDKSFEQQVREELSDLRMKPDAAVWESVAASLKKERKRRWLIWMFFLLVALSGTSVWLLTSKSSDVLMADNNKTTEHIADSAVQQKQIVKENNNIPNPDAKTENPGVDKNEQYTFPAKSLNGTTTAGISQSAQLPRRLKDNAAVISTAKTNSSAGTLIKDQQEKELLSSNAVAITNEPEKATIREREEDGNKKINKDTAFIVEEEVQKKDTVAATKAIPVSGIDSSNFSLNNKPEKRNAWEWRIGFNAGVSGMRNSIRSLFENNNTRVYENAFMNNVPPVAGGVGTSGNTKPVVRDAFAFGMYVELIKKIGTKKQNAIGFTTGYHVYTTKTGVGKQNAGTVQFLNVGASNESDKYYGIKDSASYMSYYHFIQFGVRYYQALKWFKKIDMNLYGGIGVNAMLTSNGLHLGTVNSGAYLFSNKSLLRTIQMDISGGIDFGLGKTKQIYLGPQVQFMLSNLSKQSGVNQHLFRPSVRMSFVLNKRK